MKKWIPILIISIIIFIISLLPTHFMLAWSISNGSTSVSPTSPQSVSLYMTFGSQVKGQIDISGANNDIYFYILNSAGQKVFDAGRVYNSYTLYWEATGNDYFRFVFDNSMSLITTKHVNWSFSLYYYTVSFWIIGFILLVVAVVFLLRDEVFQKTKQEIHREEPEKPKIPAPPES